MKPVIIVNFTFDLAIIMDNSMEYNYTYRFFIFTA